MNKLKAFIEAQKYNEVDDCTKYALDVYFKRIIASKMVYYQCFRHLLFLYKFETEPNFPFVYKKNPLKKLIQFSKNIIIPQTNKPFIFPPFRKFMAGFIFGWRYKNDPEKLITTEIFDVEARKQWKSSFWSMIMLAVACGFTNDSYAEIYSSGPTKETSRIPYDTAIAYLYKSPAINNYFDKFNCMHIKAKNGSLIKALPFEKSSIEGKNFSIGLLTEYHLHPSDEIQESLKSGRNLSRKNQLIIYDTTKGHNIDSVCFEREKAYKKFLKEQYENWETVHNNYDVFLFAAELDEEDYDDWQNPNNWIKANPNLNTSVSLEQLKQEFNKISSHKDEVEFKTKRLGMWVGHAIAHFTLTEITASEKYTKPIVDKWLKKRNFTHCVTAGIDLSSIHDTTHVVLNFEIEDPNGGEPIWFFVGKGYIPADNLQYKEVADRANYSMWAEKGFCEITPGKIIDYEYLVKDVKNFKEIYGIDKLGYDPWQFNIVKQLFLNSSIFMEEDMINVHQGSKLSPIFKEFERKLKNKKICFGGNTFLMNHLLNVCTKELNGTSENLLIQKVAKPRRIDGFIAMLMSSHIRMDLTHKTKEVGAYVLNTKLN